MPREFGSSGLTGFHATKVISAPNPEAAVQQSLVVSVESKANYGSFWDENAPVELQIAPTVDALPDAWFPAFSSRTRMSGRMVATFNLLNTVVGGGALSLPFAFKKCGWFVGIVIVIFSVQISSFALGLLCKLARKLSCDSYSEVVRKSMGRRAADLLDLTQFFMLFLVVVAFLILIRDISADIIEFVSAAMGSEMDLGPQQRNLALCVISAAMFPLMSQGSLHALRHVSYVGTASVLLLLFVIAQKAYLVNTSKGLGLWESVARGGPRMTARPGPENWVDVFTGLPIILIAFLCQFNVVSVYSNFRNPTPERIGFVLNCTTGTAGVLYTLFGLSGYFFATDKTADNILLNFSARDPALIAARTGLVFTLMCQTPMVLLPCRDSLWALLLKLRMCFFSCVCERGPLGEKDRLHASPSLSNQGERGNSDKAVAVTSASDSALMATVVYKAVLGSDEEEAALRAGGDGNRIRAPVESTSYSSQARLVLAPPTEVEEVTPLTRVVLTMLLCVVGVTLAVAAPGVSVIWSVAGSSISLVLAFLFPALAYLSLWFQLDASLRKVDLESCGAWVLLLLSLSMIVLCTCQSWRDWQGQSQ